MNGERVTPWFGTWPPELKGVPEMEQENNGITVWKRLFRLSWLLAITIICFLLIWFLPALYVGFQILLATIGSTSLVVFLLGGTVDWWLKQAILKDVFKAAIGYLLPPELKPEMEWVYKQDIIATKHIQECVITPIENNLVICQVVINRTLTNISHHSAEFEPILSIDEWFHSERHSNITEFGWKTSDGIRCDFKDFELEKGEHSLSVKKREGDKIMLGSKASIDVWFSYEEIKHINDEHTITFIYPTNDPFVKIEVPNDMKCKPGLTMHKQQSLKTLGHNRYQLSGTLLPGQRITIRWWSVEDSRKWQNEDPKSG